MQQYSVQQKQEYLRNQILQTGLDPQQFMQFMASYKQGQQSIVIQNWSMKELEDAVNAFKKKIGIQTNINNKSIQQTTQVILPNYTKQLTHSIILQVRQSHQKKKIQYNERLWDYQMKSQQNCQKIKHRFDFKNIQPAIDYHKYQIKKTSGYLFGFVGVKDQLWLQLMTNFTPNKVQRKSQDFDWLRQALVKKNSGAFVPPLQEFYTVQPQDKFGINNRLKALTQFMNSLLNYDYLIQSKYVYQFLTQTDYQNFTKTRKKQESAQSVHEIGAAQTIQGVFSAEVSQRTLKMCKSVNKFSQQSQIIYSSLQTNIIKVLADMQTLTKHTTYIANDFAKLHDNFIQLNKAVPQLYTGQMSTLLIYLNNLLNTLNKHTKSQMAQIKEVLIDFAKLNHKEWKQFSLFDKKRQATFRQYLDFKDNLLRRKQKCFKQISQWELPEPQLSRVKSLKLNEMSKEQIYDLMFPKQNEVQQEKRVWIGFLNFKYEKCFNLLLRAQQKRYAQQFKKYDQKMRKLKHDQISAFQQFYEILSY